MSDSEQPLHPYAADREIGIKELFTVLWHGKFVIFGVTLLAALISVGVALNLTDYYQSSALLAPKNDETGQGVLDEIGGLASVAGINLGPYAGANTAIAIETLKSRRLFHDYLYESILVELMAAESWESDSNVLVLDPEIYDSKEGNWLREVSYPRKKKPSAQEAFAVFTSLLSVADERKSGFVKISIEHISPHVAKRWVDLMVYGVNEAIRAKEITEAERSIEYLTRQLEQTAIVNLDRIFAQLIEGQTKKLMLAHASDEYVFQIIDPPIVSELKYKPQRARICITGTLFGGILAVLFVFIRYYFTQIRTNEIGRIETK